MAKFGELLRELREQAGQSMGAVARYLGVSVPYLSSVELGRRAPLTNDRIAEVANFLRLRLEDSDELISKAAEARGFFEIAADTPLRQTVGAVLARRWAHLEPDELERIHKIIDSE